MKNFREFVVESERKTSLYDESIPIIVYNKDDFEYEIWKPKFKKYGLAIGILEKKMIVWDGEAMKNLSKDEVIFVESHEAAHFKLGPKASEVDCDWLGIAMCWKGGKKGASKVGIDRFVERHGMEFDTDDLPGYDNWIGKSRKVSEDFMKECERKDFEVLDVLKHPDRYYKSLNTVDEITGGEIIKHAWDLYVESITKKKK